MGGTEKAEGFEVLEQRLAEIKAGDTDLESSKITDGVSDIESEKATGEVNEEASPKEEVDELTSEKGEEEIVSESDVSDSTDNVYSPNYQYKFQDEMFEFDERVKPVIKSKEDEDFFRDLYTKSRAMEMMKERAENVSKDLDSYKGKVSEYEAQLPSLKQDLSQKDSMIDYFSKIMDGVNRGDANSFNQFLSLCNASPEALRSLGVTMAEHLENPAEYSNVILQNQNNYRQQNVERDSKALDADRADLAAQRTQLEVTKAVQNPEIAELVKYVDDTWGAGTFENRVWSEGEALAHKRKLENPNAIVGLEEIPNIVKSVADWFSKARPASVETKSPPVVETKQRIVDNPTESLPKVRGDRGIPDKPVYASGSGMDGLEKRYKEITGEDY